MRYLFCYWKRGGSARRRRWLVSVALAGGVVFGSCSQPTQTSHSPVAQSGAEDTARSGEPAAAGPRETSDPYPPAEPTSTVAPDPYPPAEHTPTTEPGASPPAGRTPTTEPETDTPTPLPTTGEVRAFPGAEGFGTQTEGGRGGRIIYVTNLDDSGSGSLRAALEADGRRTVLFKVAGTITLKSDIDITNPFITLAGQSAPGEGVQVRGAMVKIETHDVIIRYMKLRPGDVPSSSDPENRDSLSLSGLQGTEIYNVVIDHCSLVWGPDIGGPAILSNAYDITISNSIVGEGLYLSDHPEATEDSGGHAMGLNITQLDPEKYGPGHPRRITLHHNLLTTSNIRMPQVMSAEYVDVVNNVIYNWGNKAAHGNPRKLNLINNMFIAGPMTKKLVAWAPDTNDTVPTLFESSVFEDGNMSEGIEALRGGPKSVYAPDKFTPYSIQSKESALQAYHKIIKEVGANRPVRDSADQQIIDNLKQRRGSFVNASELVWPELRSAPPEEDAESDGMPDSWEQEHFGTTEHGSEASSQSDYDDDGYTDVEEYLNGSDPTR